MVRRLVVSPTTGKSVEISSTFSVVPSVVVSSVLLVTSVAEVSSLVVSSVVVFSSVVVVSSVDGSNVVDSTAVSSVVVVSPLSLKTRIVDRSSPPLYDSKTNVCT